MLQKFIAMMQNEKGQGLVEYALIIVLISIVCVIALTAVGSGVNSVYVNLSGSL